METEIVVIPDSLEELGNVPMVYCHIECTNCSRFRCGFPGHGANGPICNGDPDSTAVFCDGCGNINCQQCVSIDQENNLMCPYGCEDVVRYE